MPSVHGAEALPLFKAAGELGPAANPESSLPPMPLGEGVIHDHRALSVSLKAHPMSFLRQDLERRRIVTADRLRDIAPGRTVTVAGLVLVRQRPGTASGVIFVSLEDETGVANAIVWPKVFEANRRTILGARVLGVRGELQREGMVIHVVAKGFIDLTSDMAAVANGHELGETAIAQADEGRAGPQGSRNRELDQHREMMTKRLAEALPAGRNFH